MFLSETQILLSTRIELFRQVFFSGIWSEKIDQFWIFVIGI